HSSRPLPPRSRPSLPPDALPIFDSPKTQMKPQTAQVTLNAVVAKTPQEAAQVYPGNYWLSLLEPPAKSEFPGTGPQGNGLGPNIDRKSTRLNSSHQIISYAVFSS